ncbi:MAG TPA: heparinase II/III family protein [Gemmatimonadales bacterium]|nr:heparinase II/III family protein [Gemmatimonadales bacterium]
MLSADLLTEHRERIERSPDLRALLATLARRVAPLRAACPAPPAHKALLSVDGGVCGEHGIPLAFDPFRADAHRCPECGRAHTGERHARAWAKHQHLWLAERGGDFAALAAFADDEDAARRAAGILDAYGERYLELPNEDNVLGPSRLFFSTYLDSVWLASFLTAAQLLRETGRLEDATAEAVSRVADEAANLIGEFDEGFSNRQTWHAAALAAVAVWFEDEELATRAIEGETGLLAHLARGFGPDGMWYEGENYHLFALRGLLTGLRWARLAGVDALEDDVLAARLLAALRAPALTALPDFTFPARKDSRFGVSLAQPMYLELWEVGLGLLRERGRDEDALADWLAALYAAPAPRAQTFESYLHEAHLPADGPTRSRADLGWWALLDMPASLDGDAAGWRPGSVLLESQGLPILRRGAGPDARYASLECGPFGGGHGHPDRLHLTLFAGGVHRLPDPGTGSYVARDLFWYRSTLAHNAPRLDGAAQPEADAQCEAFAVEGDWAWARGRWAAVERTLVSAPDYLLDRVEVAGETEHLVELPWHFLDATALDAMEVTAPGRWEPAALEGAAAEFVDEVERFVPETEDARAPLRLAGPGLDVAMRFDGELLRARAPGLPGRGERPRFYLARARGRAVRIETVLGFAGPVELQPAGPTTAVHVAGRTDHHQPASDGWIVETAGGTVRLGGVRPPAKAFTPLFRKDRPLEVEGEAAWVAAPPALDGTLDGFDCGAPLRLDHEDQYRRSELPYEGPETFSAVACVNWSAGVLYLAVEVAKPELVLRPHDAPPLLLDNEPDDIHGDGLQLYLAEPGEGGAVAGLVVTPDPASDAVRARPVAGTAGDRIAAAGAWRETGGGYVVTLALTLPDDWPLEHGMALPFDLIVNEMRPGRQRRAGQLVWSGGSGWVWLRGDRQPRERFGLLRLG